MGYIGSDPKTNESVSTAQLVDDSVTNAKIVDNVLFNSVTSSIVSASGTVTADTFTGTFSGALSSSAQIASNISSSFRGELSSSVYLRQVATTISGSLGSNAAIIRSLDRTTISGSIPQSLGTSDSPTFAGATITGTLTAQEIHTEFTSASITFTSGSHKFGNSTDDIHQMTGSLKIVSDITSDTALNGLVIDLSKDTSSANSNQIITGADIGVDVIAIKDIHAAIKGVNINVSASLTDVGSHTNSLYGIDLNVTPYASSNETAYGLKINVDDNTTTATDYGLHVTAANNYFSGNVGIGETSPLATLHVKEGDSGLSSLNSSGTNLFLEANGANAAGMTIASGNTANGYIIFGDSDSNFRGAIQYDHSSPDKMHLVTSGSQRVSIDQHGKVGIGATSPNSLIHAKVTTNTSETIRIQNDDSLTTIGVSSDGYSFHTYQHSLYYASWDGSTWSTKARLDNDGKFGLGGTSPVGKLDIAQGGYTAGTQAIHFGADTGDNTSRSNNTTKYGVITGDHYSTSEEKIELITYYSNSSSNELLIGGAGNSAYNAPTAISFRIASGYTVTSDNANTIFLVNGGGVTVKEGYPIVAGRGATSGGRILAGHYGQANGDYLAVLSTHYSSGGFIVGYGVEGKENANGYVSTQDAFSGVRTAMTQDTDGIHFLTSAATQASPGSDVTMNERARITAAGYFKAGNLLADDYSNYDASAVIGGNDHALVNRENSSYVLRCYQTHASNPYGIIVKYSNADVSNTSNHFFVGAEDNQDRFQLRSNGGLANVQSNNADLSDERTKKDITDTSSQYDFIKSLRVRNFKYKVDNDDDRVKTGVIAQEVESIDSSLIDNTGEFSTQYIDEDEEPAKMVYDKDIYFRAIKALQEAMEKIETLEAQMAQVSGSN